MSVRQSPMGIPAPAQLLLGVWGATIKVRTRIASPRNVPQSATVASLKMSPLPHAAPEDQTD